MVKKNVEVRGRIFSYSVVIYKEESDYIAVAPEFNVACQAGSVEKAKELLREAMELYVSHPKARIPTIDFVAVTTDIINPGSMDMDDCGDRHGLACQ